MGGVLFPFLLLCLYPIVIDLPPLSAASQDFSHNVDRLFHHQLVCNQVALLKLQSIPIHSELVENVVFLSQVIAVHLVHLCIDHDVCLHQVLDYGFRIHVVPLHDSHDSPGDFDFRAACTSLAPP